MAEVDAPVLVERQDNILIITINRPDARNAVNAAVHAGLGNALKLADSDPDVRVVVLTGAGDKAFCAGTDLKAMARGESNWPDDREQKSWGWAGFVRHPIGKPIIAAVNGFALGGGTELALASDLVIAAAHAEFGLPEVRRGIFAAAGGAFRLAQQLPPKIAMELLLTGDTISAARAVELGLANRVVPLDELMPATMKMARAIAANAPLAVQATKRIAKGIVEGKIASDAAFWAANKQEGSIVMRSADAREGPRAFAEKRLPIWQGK
ncbi:crotonase/enoyl-CoA hydratase family protein [Sphingobium sp. CR2-8]|uniref:crotonase/enoyl-CoA hydratase family protein n=1 Tax=Sphingobium sp. CR2-8 TaxID=1306534 RepID=UPI002DB852A7|nr:crotonase/enoyl-CoA hydratase family protein [Sphingobium sp. CR2-8]MEC3909516.1 crotonase/enoyl-CoA hydratase family protein [Sphingobium sp. CR2-8]